MRIQRWRRVLKEEEESDRVALDEYVVEEIRDKGIVATGSKLGTSTITKYLIDRVEGIWGGREFVGA